MNRGQEFTPIVESTLCAVASTASSAAAALDNQVVAEQRVAPLAVRLAGIDGRWAVTAQDILGVRDRLQVIGVDASPVTAEMVKRHPFRNWADQKLVHEPMGRERFDRAYRAESAVASTLLATSPEPAAIGLRRDIGQEPHSRLIVHEYIIP